MASEQTQGEAHDPRLEARRRVLRVANTLERFAVELLRWYEVEPTLSHPASRFSDPAALKELGQLAAELKGREGRDQAGAAAAGGTSSPSAVVITTRPAVHDGGAVGLDERDYRMLLLCAEVVYHGVRPGPALRDQAGEVLARLATGGTSPPAVHCACPKHPGGGRRDTSRDCPLHGADVIG